MPEKVEGKIVGYRLTRGEIEAIHGHDCRCPVCRPDLHDHHEEGGEG